MSENDFLYLTLKFNAEETAVDPEEPNGFLYEYEGEVLSVEDDDQRVVVGKFRAFYVDFDAAMNEGHAPFDVLDARSATVVYYELYDARGNPSPAAAKTIGEEPFMQANLLILDRLEILPQFRSRGIGLAALRTLIRRLSAGTGVIAMKPFPLQFEASYRDGDDLDEWAKQLELERFTKERRSAFAKLQRHYAKLGFKRVPKTDFMIRETDLALPKLDLLIPSWKG